MPKTMAQTLVSEERLALARRRLLAKLRRRGPAPGTLPDMASIRDFISLTGEFAAEASRVLGLDAESVAEVKARLLRSALPAFLSHWRGDRERASDLLVDAWRSNFQVPVGPAPRELLGLWDVAVSQELTADARSFSGPLVIEMLVSCLSLSQDELGRMLGVTGETVRRWKKGAVGIPESRLAELTAAESALNRLLRMFRPERLSQVIRRKADLFEGKRALDWILDGRMAEVADRYESALAFQA